MVFNLVLLTGAVQAMNLGTGISSREVRERTADFLLTRPINRASVLRQKLLTVFLLIPVTDLVFMAADWVLIQALIDDPFQFRTFLTSTSSLFLIQLFFLSFGFMLGAVMKRIKSVIAVSLPAVFGFYIIGLFDTVVGEKIKYMTPFKFFNLSLLTAGSGYELRMLIYLALLLTYGRNRGRRADQVIWRKRPRPHGHGDAMGCTKLIIMKPWRKDHQETRKLK